MLHPLQNSPPTRDNPPQKNTQKNPPDQGGQQQTDNLQTDGDRKGVPGFGNIPDRELMMQAMQIIQEANGQELTEEQTARLEKLGLTEEQIAAIQQMATPTGQQPNSARSFFSKANLLIIAGSTVFLISGLIFVVKFKRQKYI